LDVAVGSGTVVAKSLPDVHEARPARETLAMALSSGTFELIRIC
jgi:2-succinyl-5-enolpyruvyl-6-hydroxy-3-cyclohexene-1-carboxylate synthase